MKQALLNHIATVQKRVNQLKAEIVRLISCLHIFLCILCGIALNFSSFYFHKEQMDNVKEHGDNELYDKLDSAYPTEDEESEVSISSSRSL